MEGDTVSKIRYKFQILSYHATPGDTSELVQLDQYNFNEVHENVLLLLDQEL